MRRRKPVGVLGLVLAILLLVPIACGGGGAPGPTAAAQPGPTQPPPPPPPEAPRELTSPGLQNLVAFTRLLGVVRHFHPSSEASKVAWDYFAIEGMRRAEGQATPADLARFLQDYLQPIAPTLQVFLEGENPALPPALANGSGPTLVHWSNRGWGLDNRGESAYSNLLQSFGSASIPPYVPRPIEPWEVALPRGLRGRVPLALWADTQGSLPKSTRTPDYRIYSHSLAEDRGTRLAAVALAWNIWQHFFPYHEAVGADWPAVLEESLEKAALDRTAAEFRTTLGRMQWHLVDGHGTVLPAEDLSGNAPFYLDWVENRWVVARFIAQPPAEVKLGDTVLSVDGISLEDRFNAFENRTSGSLQWKRANARRELLAGPMGASMILGMRRTDGSSYTLTVARVPAPWNDSMVEPKPAPVAELRPGVWYVDLSRAYLGDVSTLIPKLASARAVLVDLRGYPRDGAFAPLFAALIQAPIEGIRIRVPLVDRPDNPLGRTEDSQWRVAPQPSGSAAKVVAITDGRAISFAESVLSLTQGAGWPLVGAPSAGANGNVTYLRTPGGFQVIFTGMQVLLRDGSRHFTQGVPPTVAATRTVQGIAAGKDELLEKALAVVDPQ